jgi:hypothetical protein
MLWLTSTRYVHAITYRDLLDDLVVEISHGGRESRLGGKRKDIVKDDDEAAKVLADLHKIRVPHGYLLQ